MKYVLLLVFCVSFFKANAQYKDTTNSPTLADANRMVLTGFALQAVGVGGIIGGEYLRKEKEDGTVDRTMEYVAYIAGGTFLLVGTIEQVRGIYHILKSNKGISAGIQQHGIGVAYSF